jgi:hypothetical protein
LQEWSLDHNILPEACGCQLWGKAPHLGNPNQHLVHRERRKAHRL